MTSTVADEIRGQRHTAFVYICRDCAYHLTVITTTTPSARKSDALAQRKRWKLAGGDWLCPDCVGVE